MKTHYRKQKEIMKKCLQIEKIISIRFSHTKTLQYKKYNDTACTALARSFENKKSTYIDRKYGQLCSGGNYFLKIIPTPKEEVCNVYVKDEKVFRDNTTCENFIKKIPKYPSLADKRYILISPLSYETKKPDVIMFLATPAQASRILGLSVYKEMSCPVIVPALSTCASIYAPLAAHAVHINFIDYYDRYYQGMQRGRSVWKDSELIMAMPYDIFDKIIQYIPLSAHGSYKPKIQPKSFDRL